LLDDRAVRDADARSDWENRIYRRLTDTDDADPALALSALNRVATSSSDPAAKARCALRVLTPR
jgi:hypothetical protein